MLEILFIKKENGHLFGFGSFPLFDVSLSLWRKRSENIFNNLFTYKGFTKDIGGKRCTAGKEMSRECYFHSVITTQKKYRYSFNKNVYERNYVVVACHGVIPDSTLKGDLK